MRRPIGGAVFLILFAATVAYPNQPEQAGGVIKGLVTFSGTPPSPPLLVITKDREVCATAPLYDQSLLVGRDGGVQNAVVTIANTNQVGVLKPEPTVQFDQKGCQYVPHVAVFPAGSAVVILNSDGILHNIHTESVINPVIDLAQPGFKKRIRVTIARPEVIKVTCDAHNWMEGWWYVTATPYYAITDEHGSYAIRNVPAGTYDVRVWQERLGGESQRVVVKPGKETAANFILKALKGRGS
jgi:Carboxypeptidase regulatory-like domain